jgi:isopentenyl diphosphate isomerase/L-lactate dehydrogenase-like FMN-dependent dehydrogenase
MPSHLLQSRGYNVAMLRGMARRRLPRMVFDFVDGGAEEERTLRANERAFAGIGLLPRPLNGTDSRDQGIELLGRRLASPVIVGPTGLSGLLWEDGEIAAARAAHAAGTVYCVSHASTASLEAIAAAAPGPSWFQVFMYRDRGLTRALAERAQAAGYEALVLTTDNQVMGRRERDVRNGFSVPPRIGPSNLLDLLLRPAFLYRMLRGPRPTMANYLQPGEEAGLIQLAARMGELLDPAASWKDVAWLRGVWRGPLILKGVLHPLEAREAVAQGVDSVVVSNHGGRQLEDAPATIRALPGVVEAVEGRIPVLIDGGIRRGADVVKALALGARACLIGRPHLWGLAAAGEEGVAWVLELYRQEIDRVLALGGWDGVAALGPEVLDRSPDRAG